MHYTVGYKDSRNFEVFNDHMQSLGKLEYTSWLQTKAQIITSDNNSYHIAPANFWKQRMLITKNGMPYAETSYNWKGRMHISFPGGSSYVFSPKSIWRSNNYVLRDSAEQDIATVESNFKLKKFNFDYQIDVQDNSLSKEDNLVLPLLLLFCTKNMHMRRAH